MPNRRIVLALVPHPDDAEFYAGGTLARMIDAGVRVVIVIATDGRRGSYEHDAETLARLRAAEAQAACRVLGAEPPILLGHHDFELELLPAGSLREQFVKLIRLYQPDTLIAQDPLMVGELHPDHRAVAWAAAEAVTYAELPLLYPEHLAQGLRPHFTPEKFFYTEDAAAANKIVDVSDFLDQKLAALGQHRTQVRFLVEGIMRQARLAGLDPAAALGDAALDPQAALAWAIQTQAAQVGQAAGFRYGEMFRFVRFDPLVETLLVEKPAL